MKAVATPSAKALPMRLYVAILCAAWTVVIAGALAWGLIEGHRQTLEAARIQARSAFEKDVLYRRWNAMHGGVYAPVTEQTPPNPDLRIPQREITDPAGRQLTKINPAYMTRQVHELGQLQTGIQGHITSLKPIRLANAPDAWEAGALQAFENGVEEVSSIELLRGASYMRLMRPLVTETSCLQCHEQQGYKVGEVRGGISASVPMAPLQEIARPRMIALSVGHAAIWLIGLGAIALGGRDIQRRSRERDRIQEEREKLIVELRDALDQVKTLRGILPICSHCKKVRDDQGYWQQVEVYIHDHTDAEFSHGYCEDCVQKLYPEVADEVLKNLAIRRSKANGD